MTQEIVATRGAYPRAFRLVPRVCRVCGAVFEKPSSSHAKVCSKCKKNPSAFTTDDEPVDIARLRAELGMPPLRPDGTPEPWPMRPLPQTLAEAEAQRTGGRR